METLRTVLKDCKFGCHDIPPHFIHTTHVQKTYTQDELDMLVAKFQGVQTKIGCLLLTAHHTYQTEFVLLKLHYKDSTLDDANKLTLCIAKEFEVISPPVLHTKQDLEDLINKPTYMEFTIRFKSTYTAFLLLMSYEVS
jgi:hypothetical protein